MKSAIYVLLSFVFIISSHFQEVEANKKKLCICNGTFEGRCANTREAFCENLFKKNLQEKTAFNCGCTNSSPHILCTCHVVRPAQLCRETNWMKCSIQVSKPRERLAK
nr:S-locus cysteine-rich protein [Brassica oleracea]